jgi:putative nucleotidyltransferase with HDIG domain
VLAEFLALALALALAVIEAPHADWDPALFVTLLALSIIGDLAAVDTAASRVKLSSSFLAIVIAIVFLGATPATLIALITILASWTRDRYPAPDLLINLLTYACFPLVTGIGFHELVAALGTDPLDPAYYLLILALFAFALAIDFLLIAGYSAYVEGSSFISKLRRAHMPVWSSEIASALLACGVAWMYMELGDPAVALFAVVLLTFQFLLGELLLSQQRGDELELRAKQLAGFQVALLSALLRTLDLRDRMTARHSAAVARYAREVAAEAGLSEEEQERAHTAGLLHDIGKFVLPDRILKGDAKLAEADWDQIRTHPYEGARIVSEIDGYQPIGELILAHHERVDGLGYPRGLSGDQIPLIARIIAVVDAYDVMTARETYRDPVDSFEAVAELKRMSGTQFDAEVVEAFVRVLDGKDLAYRHGEDADFEAELRLEGRISDYVGARKRRSPRDRLLHGAT